MAGPLPLVFLLTSSFSHRPGRRLHPQPTPHLHPPPFLWWRGGATRRGSVIRAFTASLLDAVGPPRAGHASPPRLGPCLAMRHAAQPGPGLGPADRAKQCEQRRPGLAGQPASALPRRRVCSGTLVNFSLAMCRIRARGARGVAVVAGVAGVAEALARSLAGRGSCLAGGRGAPRGRSPDSALTPPSSSFLFCFGGQLLCATRNARDGLAARPPASRSQPPQFGVRVFKRATCPIALCRS